jgi:hypothetical protein
MHVEIWLRTNARAVLFGMILPAAIAILGLAVVTGLGGNSPPVWLRALGGVFLAVGLAAIAGLAWQLKRPRLAYQPGELLIWLRGGAPFRVPIDAVECFWLGQGPSMLPGKRHENTEAATIVIRIADKAVDWRHREVKPQLGMWCEGYVTIRGTWCEPLNIDLVNRLNLRLAELTQSRKAAKNLVT